MLKLELPVLLPAKFSISQGWDKSGKASIGQVDAAVRRQGKYLCIMNTHTSLFTEQIYELGFALSMNRRKLLNYRPGQPFWYRYEHFATIALLWG